MNSRLSAILEIAPTVVAMESEATWATFSPGQRTVLVVDGNSLFHRAWHAYERSGMSNSAGRPVFGTYGFLALLSGISDKVVPDAIVVGFDDQRGSTRKARCQEYKATRGDKSPDLYVQMNDTHLALRELGVAVITPPGLEADDVLGSVAATAEQEGWRCVIATSDRDAFSLISATTTVLRLVSGLDNAVWMTPDVLVQTYGIRPEQYLDFAALRGDPSDNLAGVQGIGEKTAAKLLAGLGSLDSALDDLPMVATIAGPSVAKKLASPEARTAIDRNRDIMSINRTIPVDLQEATLRSDAQKVGAVLRKLELPSLATRLTAALCRTPAQTISV